MRIVLVAHSGLVDYTIGLANALTGYGTVMLMAPQLAIQPFLSFIHSHVIVNSWRSLRLRNPRNVLLTKQIVDEIAGFKPDVIHFQGGFLWFTIMLPLLKQWPLITTVHDAEPHRGDHGSNRIQWFMPNRFAARYSDALIVHSQYVLNKIRPLAEENATVIHHITPGDGFIYVPKGRIEHREDIDVLFFGRIVAYKGLDLLVEAVNLVACKFADVRVCIAGEGHVPEKMRKSLSQTSGFQLINRYIAPADVADLFLSAKMVVLPYKDASQSGVVPLSYSFARPVITTTVGGLHEIVDHGSTGLHVPPDDTTALADAISFLLKHPDKRRQMGQQGLAKVKHELSWPHAAYQTIQVYQEIMERHANRQQAI